MTTERLNWTEVKHEKEFTRWHQETCGKKDWGLEHSILRKWSKIECYSVMSDSMQPHGLHSPWNSPGQVLEWVDFPSLGDLPKPGLNPGLPNWRQILYQLSHKGSPLLTFKIYIWSPFLDTVSCWETVTGCFKVIRKRQEMNKRWPFDNVEDLIYINRKWDTNTLYLANLRIRVKSTN